MAQEEKNASPPAAAPRPHRRRAARWLLGSLAGLLLALALLAAGLWAWSGTGQSLATVLALAARHLPAGQSLETRGVSGSLRAGGHIGWLRWQGPTLAVEVRDADIGWQLAPLLHRRLQLGELHAAQVALERRGPPSDRPAEPLTGLTLPIDIDLPFRIDALRWSGPPALAATGLAGRYHYGSGLHRLDIDGVDVADGHYRAQVRLQGAAPMALDATLDGRVLAPMPEGVAPLTVQAHAGVQGALAGAAARLQVTTSLQPEEKSAAATAPPDALRAAVQAQLAPWAPQPVVRARIELANVDAARLWPGAPQTLLSGQVAVEPEAAATVAGPTAWQADIDLRNARPGPWDAQQLPLERIEASARFDGTHWVVPHATLDVGGGRVEAEGRWGPAPEPWQARASVRDVRPQALHTGLDAAPVDGTVSAQQRDDAIDFEADLRARAPAAAPRPKAREASAPGGFRVDRVQARGQWRERTLALETLRIDAGAARLEGHATAHLDTQSGAGKLDLLLPGGQARIEGEIGRTRGAGRAVVQVDDAAALQRWVERLPGLSKVFDSASAQGSAQLDASWNGGWEAVQRLQDSNAAPTTSRAAALRLQARLAVPRLDLRLPVAAAAAGPATTVSMPEPPGPGASPSNAPTSATPLRLRGVRAELSGTPSDAALALDGEATLGTRTFSLSTRASGGQTARAQWRLALASLHLQTQDSATGPGAWTVDLGGPASATVRRTDSGAAGGGARLQVETTAGSASVRGPVPGVVRLEWQPVQFSQVAGTDAAGGGSYRLRSQGRLLGLPMAWAQALGAPNDDTIGGVGIGGDLVFDGDWDIDAVDTLRAQARLARRSGDLRVQAGEALVTRIRSTGTGTPTETVVDAGGAGATTPAGLRQAELVLTAQGDAVRAQLAWDSERAGQVKADVTTRVARQGDGWRWPESATLAGQLHARLPDIGVWSMLAPPGWRVGGTLEADATLSGTRALPQWQGQLGADGLSVKAPVEGIDLRDGRLRAALRGDRLELTEFTLRGGAASSARIAGQSGNLSTARSEGASDGGTLSARGSATWSAAPGGGDSGIRMAIDAEARALRLLVRSDRQASVSGQLRLGLAQGLLSVRGALKIDRAVLILPDETAPSLGSDVVVRSAARDREAARLARRERDRAERADQAERAAPATAQTRKPPDIDVSVDLGDDFAAQGRGVTTRLAGQVELRSSAATAGALRLAGEVRTVKGRYSAYGQDLDIETGIARFSGPYDNPALDILALRPNITQRAGVQITGSALAPRVKLYSEPALSDAETLSWIVLGRASASGGAEALLMQQAALALLGGLGNKGSGSLASRFGLDEVGFKGPGTGNDVRDSAITLGKRLSRDFYVTYERSLAGTLGTLYIFYDLTRHLTLRAQAGSSSAIDLIYKISYD